MSAAQEKMQVDAIHVDDAVPMQMDGASELYLTQKRGGVIAKDAAVDHKRIIKVLLDEDMLAHKGVAVVRAASLILAQLLEGYAA